MLFQAGIQCHLFPQGILHADAFSESAAGFFRADSVRHGDRFPCGGGAAAGADGFCLAIRAAGAGVGGVYIIGHGWERGAAKFHSIAAYSFIDECHGWPCARSSVVETLVGVNQDTLRAFPIRAKVRPAVTVVS